MRVSEALRGPSGTSLGLHLDIDVGVSEKGFECPTEGDLYAMLARFQENCSQLPAESPGSKADLAAMSSPCSLVQHIEQEEAVSPDAFEHDPAHYHYTADNQACDQGEYPTEEHPSAASEAHQAIGMRAAMYMDTLEPDQAGQVPLRDYPAVTARLATCSDDEDFAVLDFGGGSGGSSECSFGAEGTAAQCETVYSAPRCCHLAVQHPSLMYWKCFYSVVTLIICNTFNHWVMYCVSNMCLEASSHDRRSGVSVVSVAIVL